MKLLRGWWAGVVLGSAPSALSSDPKMNQLAPLKSTAPTPASSNCWRLAVRALSEARPDCCVSRGSVAAGLLSGSVILCLRIGADQIGSGAGAGFECGGGKADGDAVARRNVAFGDIQRVGAFVREPNDFAE